MGETTDGGPAFPCTSTPETVREWDGMSLRDFFASVALIARADGYISFDAKLRATEAYGLADAMLAQREKPRG